MGVLADIGLGSSKDYLDFLGNAGENRVMFLAVVNERQLIRVKTPGRSVVLLQFCWRVIRVVRIRLIGVFRLVRIFGIVRIGLFRIALITVVITIIATVTLIAVTRLCARVVVIRIPWIFWADRRIANIGLTRLIAIALITAVAGVAIAVVRVGWLTSVI